MTTDTTQAREGLGDAISLALDAAEEYMRVAEAHHKAIGGDVLNPNGSEQRASLPVSVKPPECGACGDVDRANCAVCGPAC